MMGIFSRASCRFFGCISPYSFRPDSGNGIDRRCKQFTFYRMSQCDREMNWKDATQYAKRKRQPYPKVLLEKQREAHAFLRLQNKTLRHVVSDILYFEIEGDPNTCKRMLNFFFHRL